MPDVGLKVRRLILLLQPIVMVICSCLSARELRVLRRMEVLKEARGPKDTVARDPKRKTEIGPRWKVVRVPLAKAKRNPTA